MDTEKVREALKDRNLARVAEATGLHHNTLIAIRSGRVEKPNPSTIKVLSAYLFGAND